MFWTTSQVTSRRESAVQHLCGAHLAEVALFWRYRNGLCCPRTTRLTPTQQPPQDECHTGVGQHFHGETWLVKLFKTLFLSDMFSLFMCVTLKTLTYAASTVGGVGRVMNTAEAVVWVAAARPRNGFFFPFFVHLRIRMGVTHKCPNAVKSCMATWQKVTGKSPKSYES